MKYVCIKSRLTNNKINIINNLMIVYIQKILINSFIIAIYIYKLLVIK